VLAVIHRLRAVRADVIAPGSVSRPTPATTSPRCPPMHTPFYNSRGVNKIRGSHGRGQRTPAARARPYSSLVMPVLTRH